MLSYTRSKLSGKTCFELGALSFVVCNSGAIQAESKYKAQSTKFVFVLVHVVGLAPTQSLGTPDLQSGAFAAQPHMQTSNSYVKK